MSRTADSKRKETAQFDRLKRIRYGELGEESALSFVDDVICDEQRLKRQMEFVRGWMESTNPDEWISCVGYFRRLLCLEENMPTQEIIAMNAHKRMMEMLHETADRRLQYEILWVFSNITVGDSEKAYAIIDAGFLDIIPKILKSGDPLVVEQTIWVVSNLCGDSQTPRDSILEAGILEILQRISFQEMGMSVIGNVAWLISNIFRTRPFPRYGAIADSIPILKTLIEFCWDDSVLVELLWSLSHITDHSPTHFVNYIVQPEFLNLLLKNITHKRVDIQTPAIRAIGNLASGDDSHTQKILEAGILQHMPYALKSSNNSIVKEGCWLLSNMCCGTHQQIQDIIDSKILETLMKMVDTWTSAVKKEIYWAFANISTSCSVDHMEYLIDIGITRKMLEGFNRGDHVLTCQIISGLVRLLTHGEVFSHLKGYNFAALDFGQRGLDILEELQIFDTEQTANVETIRGIVTNTLKGALKM